MTKCICSEDFCECWSVRMDPNSALGADGIPHCYKCSVSEKLIGGGLECYGTFHWSDCKYGQPDGPDDFIKDCECGNE